MNLSRFINRPVLSTVISIFIVLFGIISLGTLPIEQYPDIAPPTIRVSTTYTGANAQSVLNSEKSARKIAFLTVKNLLFRVLFTFY